MSCDVGKAAEGLENEALPHSPPLTSLHLRHCSFSNPSAALPTSQLILHHSHFTYVTAHSPTLPLLYLHHCSFSNPSAALPTSQLILQSFRCLTYVIVTSPTSQLILQPFCRFIYAAAHSTTLPLLTYITGSSSTSPGELTMHRGMKSLWWTSLLQQVTKFRSSYSFG